MHSLLELGRVLPHTLVQARLGDRDGKLGGHFLGDADLLGLELPHRAPEAQGPNELAAGDHGHHHVDVDTRAEEGLSLGAPRQGVDIDHLQLTTPQHIHVAHQRQGKANAGPGPDAATAGRGQPLDLAGLPVEEVHDGAGHPEQLAQTRNYRGRESDGGLLGDHRQVDLVQQLEPLGVLRKRCLGGLQVRHVDRHDEDRAPPRERHGMRDDVDRYYAATLRPVPPDPGMPHRARGEVGHDRLELGHVLRRPDVDETHAEELRARVAVVFDRRRIHLQEGKRVQIVDPHGERIVSEEEAEIRRTLLERLPGAPPLSLALLKGGGHLVEGVGQLSELACIGQTSARTQIAGAETSCRLEQRANSPEDEEIAAQPHGGEDEQARHDEPENVAPECSIGLREGDGGRNADGDVQIPRVARHRQAVEGVQSSLSIESPGLGCPLLASRQHRPHERHIRYGFADPRLRGRVAGKHHAVPIEDGEHGSCR